MKKAAIRFQTNGTQFREDQLQSPSFCVSIPKHIFMTLSLSLVTANRPDINHQENRNNCHCHRICGLCLATPPFLSSEKERIHSGDHHLIHLLLSSSHKRSRRREHSVLYHPIDRSFPLNDHLRECLDTIIKSIFRRSSLVRWQVIDRTFMAHNIPPNVTSFLDYSDDQLAPIKSGRHGGSVVVPNWEYKAIKFTFLRHSVHYNTPSQRQGDSFVVRLIVLLLGATFVGHFSTWAMTNFIV